MEISAFRTKVQWNMNQNAKVVYKELYLKISAHCRPFSLGLKSLWPILCGAIMSALYERRQCFWFKTGSSTRVIVVTFQLFVYGTLVLLSLCLQNIWHRSMPDHQQAACWPPKLDILFYWFSVSQWFWWSFLLRRSHLKWQKRSCKVSWYSVKYGGNPLKVCVL